MHNRRRSKFCPALIPTFAALALLGLPVLAQETVPPPLGSRQNPILISLPDSLFALGLVDTTGEYQAFVVRGRRLTTRQSDGRTLLGQSAIDASDAAAAADLAPILPSTRVSVNSRGESVLSVRGASERHVGVFWEDIPLTVPWDERLDISLIPVDALGGAREQRGLPTLSLGPNLLAGRLDLMPWRLGLPGAETRLGFSLGEAGAYEARVAHVRRSDDLRWDFLVAAGRRARNATVLPEDFRAEYNQAADRLARSNSDLEQNSALLSARRGFANDSELRVLFLAHDGEKGVPPETHVAEARYWRYPKLRRLLFGVSGHVHPDSTRHWRLEASVSADAFAQKIRSYDDITYSSPTLAPGVDLEDDEDLTWYGRVGVERNFAAGHRLRLIGSGRLARHDESLVLDEPQLRYEQRLGSVIGEWEQAWTLHWRSRLGAGYEAADTPQTGDKPDKSSTDAPVLLAAVEWQPQETTQAALRISRRSRFPSLRESFSGALGRFVLNPDLGPEEQDLLELDLSHQSSRLELSAAVFASQLGGAIERVNLPPETQGDPERFQRVNLDDVRTLGAEISASAQGPGGISTGASLMGLHTRTKVDGEYTGYVEDRPEFLLSGWLGYTHARGLRLRLENFSTGARASAGSSTLLASQTQWNARLAYVHFGGSWAETEFFLRANNLFSAVLWSQSGLPEAGQTFSAGFRLRI